MKDGYGGRNLRELTLNCQFDSAEHTTKSRCRPRSARSPFDPGTEGMRQYLPFADELWPWRCISAKEHEDCARTRKAVAGIAGSSPLR